MGLWMAIMLLTTPQPHREPLQGVAVGAVVGDNRSGRDTKWPMNAPSSHSSASELDTMATRHTTAQPAPRTTAE